MKPGSIVSRYATIWTETEHKQVLVTEEYRYIRSPDELGRPGRWVDPIGAAYMHWRDMTPAERAGLMTETALDLAMQGYDLQAIIREFAKVDCFYALGRESVPMCRALTQALLGRCLEPNTMSFDGLMEHYEVTHVTA